MGCNTSEISISFFWKTWCFDRANIQIFYLLNRVCVYIYICIGANSMQVSSELCVWNWFKCAGNILSVDSVCIFTGFSPGFVQLEKGVGANLKQVYKFTSRLLLQVELVEWSKEYSKCEFYLCICMVSFVGMHHLDRSMLYTHTHTPIEVVLHLWVSLSNLSIC